jgi:hypothetical protein
MPMADAVLLVEVGRTPPGRPPYCGGTPGGAIALHRHILAVRR